MNYENEIIRYCKKNRISTTEVADALGKNGVFKGVVPINPGKHCVGKVRTIFTAFDSNYELHDQITNVKDDEVVIIFAHKCDDRAIIGDLVAKYLILYKSATSIIIDGLIRDVAGIKRENYPIWSKGFTPLGCYNKETHVFPLDLKAEIKDKYENGIAICDDGGVTIIHRDLVNSKTLDRLERIEKQEDIWFYCLDTLKWSTKKIVCDKAYLTEPDLFPKNYFDNIEDLKNPLD